MEDENGYVILERGDKRGSAGRCPPRQGAGLPAWSSEGSGRRHIPSPAAGSGYQGSQRVRAASPCCPRRLLAVLTVALALSLVLCLSWCVAQLLQSTETAGYEDASLAMARSRWDGIFREMRRVLCPPRESEGCRLCAVGWRLLGAKCYWISDGMNPWNRSREDCRDRGSALLMPWDQDELEFLNESLQNPTRHFWIGLSVPVAGMGWTWENGSDLNQERIRLELGKGSCGTLKGNGISPQGCNTRLQWICQKESIQI